VSTRKKYEVTSLLTGPGSYRADKKGSVTETFSPIFSILTDDAVVYAPLNADASEALQK